MQFNNTYVKIEIYETKHRNDKWLNRPKIKIDTIFLFNSAISFVFPEI